jgi:hypothetical protein
MPAQDGRRLNYLDCVNQIRPKPDHPNHEGAITAVQSNPRRRMSQCKVQLMPKKQNFGFKPGARLEQIGYERSNGLKESNHRVS